MGSLKESLLNMLYPRVCPICGQILVRARVRNHDEDLPKRGNLLAGIRAETGFTGDDNPYICSACYKKLDFIDGPRCPVCSKPVEEDGGLCSDCRDKKRDFDGGVALMNHNELARNIIYDYKFRGRRDNADFLAYEAARRFGRMLEEWQIDAIIPVPLHPSRKRERGFNQAELLAVKFAGFCAGEGHPEIPVITECLVRSVKTAPQKDIEPDKRIPNVSGAFAVNSEAQTLLYKNILIVDDIFTSGATVNSCARTLKEAGAEKVYFLTMSCGQ